MKIKLTFLFLIFSHFLAAQFYPEYIKTFSGINGTEIVYDAAIDDLGNRYVAGYLKTTEIGGELVYASGKLRNGFIAKYDLDGNLVWINLVPAQISSHINKIAYYDNKIYFTGSLEGSVNFVSSDNTSFSFESNLGEDDVFFGRSSTDGIFEWVKNLGGTSNELIQAINVGQNGFFLAGQLTTASYVVDFTPGSAPTTITSTNSKDGFLVGYDLTGNYVWHQLYSGSNNENYIKNLNGDIDYLYAYGVQGGNLNLYANIGNHTLMNPSNTYARNIVKIRKSNGAVVWSKIVSTNSIIGHFAGIAMKENSIYMSGMFLDSVIVYNGVPIDTLVEENNNAQFIIKMDTTGDFKWIRQVSTNMSAISGYAYIYGMTILSDKLICQLYSSSDTLLFATNITEKEKIIAHPNKGSMVLAQISNTGELLNHTKYGNEINRPSSEILVSNSNRLFVAGNFSESLNFNFPYDISRNNFLAPGGRYYGATYKEQYLFQQKQSVGDPLATTNNTALGTCMDDSANVYTVGFFEGNLLINNITYNSHGQRDIYVIKRDAQGNLKWVRTAGGLLDDEARKLVFKDGKLYVTGYYEGTSIFSYPYMAGQLEIGSAGGSDIFVWKLDAITGIPEWIRRGGGPQDDEGNDICFSGEYLYIAGNYRQTANFNTPSANNGLNQLISAGGDDAFILKMSLAGSVVWLRRAGGTLFDEGTSVTANNSGVFLGGAFNDLANFNTPSSTSTNTLLSNGERDIFIVKYDHNGALEWTQKAGGTGTERIFSLACSAINVFTTGFFEDTLKIGKLFGASNKLISKGLRDAFVLSFGSGLGTINWFKSVRSNSNAIGSSIDFDGGDLLVAGRFEGIASVNEPQADSLISLGLNDAFLAYYKSNGEFVGFKRAGGQYEDDITDVVLKKPFFSCSGNYYVQADFNTPSTFSYNYLVNVGGAFLGFSATGSLSIDLVNAFIDGSDNGGEAKVEFIGADADGNIYQVGNFLKKIDDNGISIISNTTNELNFIKRLDKQGRTKWIRPIYNFSFSHFNKITVINNNLYVVGTFIDTLAFNYPYNLTNNFIVSPNGINAVFIACFNKNTGAFNWAKKIGNTSNTYGFDLNNDGVNMFISGNFTGTLDLGSPENPASNSLVSQGGTDSFIAKFAPNGSLVWSRRIGGIDYDKEISISLFNGNLYLFGEFSQEMNFNTPFSTSTNTLTAGNGGIEYFLAKFNTDGVYQWSKRMGGSSTQDFWDIEVNNSGIYVASVLDDLLPNFSNPYVSGTNEFPLNNNYTGFLAKFSLSGDFQWVNFAEASGSLSNGQVFDTYLFVRGADLLWVFEFDDTLKIRNPQNNSEFAINPQYNSGDIAISSIGNNGTLNWVEHGNTPTVFALNDAIVSKNSLYLSGFMDFSTSTFFGKNVFYDLQPLNEYPYYLMKLSFCDNNYVLSSPEDDTGLVTLTKITDGMIQANNKITEEATVKYIGQSIEFLPGFKADTGTVFMAETGGCD